MNNNNYTNLLITGKENLQYKDKQLPFSVLDFWKWSSSDLLSNATRGIFAEFIVACALDIDISKPREEWSSYDLVTENNIKIEVKSSAYIQSWNQSKESKILFSIKPTKEWDKDNNRYSEEIKRQADVYVFCLLKHKDRNTIDPLNLSQWDFYVVSTEQLNSYEGSEHSITLNSLEKISKAVEYEKIKEEVYSFSN